MARFVDQGAIFGGWVGLGMGLVLAISFELIIPVQSLVFLGAPLVGILIGIYANVRSERWRPRPRVVTNAIYAAAVTGIGLALLYVIIRLVFIYGDTGAMPDGTSLTCQTGPDCIYERYVDADQADELAALGITDARTLESAAWRELLVTGTALFVLTLGGGLMGGIVRGVSSPPQSMPLPKAGQAASGV